MIDRRTFLAGTGAGLLAPPLAAEAQQAGKVWRIGLLGTVPLTEPGAARLWSGFFEGLEQLGYVEGKNIVIEGRYSVLSNPGDPVHPRSLREAAVAARALNVRLQILKAQAPTEVAGALSAATKESVDALLVLGDPMFFGERERITGLAAKSRLPLIAHQSEFAEAGGLLTYGINQRDNFRRAATYVDKILKGVRPADLPVAAHQIRAGHQPQDRQGVRPDDSAVTSLASGSGDRVMA